MRSGSPIDRLASNTWSREGKGEELASSPVDNSGAWDTLEAPHKRGFLEIGASSPGGAPALQAERRNIPVRPEPSLFST